ncbi:MAG: hypothetical protein EPN20_17140 [Magnetospirillum sp.]|nr:MAG: hypothetical protein EPN20_17140 [Magnetospirillum sp.]
MIAPPPTLPAVDDETGAVERMSDIAHPTTLWAWVSAPLVILAMTVVAATSGGLRLLGRAAAVVIMGVGLAAGVFGSGLRRTFARLGSAMARLFTLQPETASHHRHGDGVFHAGPAAPEAMAPAVPADQALAVIEAALARLPAKGNATLPDDMATLATLLATPPPANDFNTADMVRDCFASLGASAPASRALLAVATHLAMAFGTPDRRPLATIRAWRMLDAPLFQDEFAAQLTAISDFITDWQKTQQTFLCLEFGEVELIEFLFESLSPAHHADILCEVLNFKVLSNRRQGILRRIPHRLRKRVQTAGGHGPDIIAHVAATQALLDRIAVTRNYAPIVEAAVTALDEVKKIAEKLQPLPSAGPMAEGQPFARITPVKRSAAELARQAMAAPRTAPPTPPQATPGPAAPEGMAPEGMAMAPAMPPPTPSRLPATGRRAIAPGPRLSAATPPFQPPKTIGTVSSRAPLATVSTTTRPLPPGSRPPLPTVAMSPLPVLALGSPAVPTPAKPRAPVPSVTGRIALPPSLAPTAPATAPSPTTATGRIVIPPVAPAEAKGSVTALTVVPKAKRPPITQAVKRQSVLKVLRGEPTATVAAALGIRESKLDEWVDAFVAAGVGALTPSPRKRRKTADSAPLSAETLRAKLAEVLATAQMIERAMDAQLPPRRPVLLPPPDKSGGHGHAARRPHKKG